MFFYSFIFLLFLFNMVRNTFGGSKAKSSARKNFHTSSNNIILPTSPDHEFAFVTHNHGNLFKVILPDNSTINCFIRGKNKGRFKKNSFVNIHSFILIHKWAFESTIKNSDFIFSYNNSHFISLYSFPSFLTLLNIVKSSFPLLSSLSFESENLRFSEPFPSNEDSEEKTLEPINESDKINIEEVDINFDDI